jgi:hypothetical protein
MGWDGMVVAVKVWVKVWVRNRWRGSVCRNRGFGGRNNCEKGWEARFEEFHSLVNY